MAKKGKKETGSQKRFGLRLPSRGSAHTLLVLASIVAIVYFTVTQTYSYLWRTWLPLETYHSQDLGFQLDIPKGWHVEEAFEYQQVAFTPTKDEEKSDPNSGIALSRSQTPNMPGTASAEQYFSGLRRSLDQGFTASEAQQKTSLEGYRRLDQTEATIGGHPALMVNISIDNFGHQTGVTGQGVIAYIYVNRDLQYVLAATGTESDQAFLSQRTRILRTFRTI